MSKKIMILNGSPRKNGNTADLIKAFTEGAEEAGHTVARFDLHTMNVKPCIGCLGGGRDSSSPCTQKDEMDKIYPAYKDADVVVLASPMYYWTFTAQLKTAIDRLFAVTEELGHTPPKACALLMCAGDNSDDNWETIIHYFEGMTHRLSWENLGMIRAGDVNHIGEIRDTPYLEEARAFGASM